MKKPINSRSIASAQMSILKKQKNTRDVARDELSERDTTVFLDKGVMGA